MNNISRLQAFFGFPYSMRALVCLRDNINFVRELLSLRQNYAGDQACVGLEKYAA
jgi:hypothetical protein